MITLIPFVSELSVRTAYVLGPNTLCLVIRGSLDINSSLVPLIVQASALEFPVAQIHVIVPPGHTDCLSHVTNAAPKYYFKKGGGGGG